MAYGCRGISEKVASGCPEFPYDEKTLEQFSLYVIRSWMADHEVLEALNRCGKNSLLIECIRMNANQIKNIRLLYDFGEAAFDYFINMVYAMLSGILTTWVQRDQKESGEKINDIFLKPTGRCFKDRLFSNDYE